MQENENSGYSMSQQLRCTESILPYTLVTALVNRPVIFLQMLAVKAVDVGASSLITVFSPSENHPYYYEWHSLSYRTNADNLTVQRE